MARKSGFVPSPSLGNLAMSPLIEEEIEPIILNKDEYLFENYFPKIKPTLLKEPPEFKGADDSTSKILPKPMFNIVNTDSSTNSLKNFAFNRQLSKSLPLISFPKMTVPSNFVKYRSKVIQCITLHNKFSEEIYNMQMNFISKIPEPPKKQPVIISISKDTLNFIPDEESEFRTVLQRVVSEEDQLLVVDSIDDAIRIYNNNIDNDTIEDDLFNNLSKIINFSSRFPCREYNVFDVSLLAASAADSVIPQYRVVFSEIAGALEAGFIARPLYEKLDAFFKPFNDRRVTLMRWALRNLIPDRIVDGGFDTFDIKVSLWEPRKGDKTPDEQSVSTPQTILVKIIDASDKAVAALKRKPQNEVVASWVTYFEAVSSCFAVLLEDYSDIRLIRSGPLFSKTLSALTKFGSASGSISPDLPDVVSEVVEGVSCLDEFTAHSRVGVILRSEIPSSLMGIAAAVRDTALSIRDPSLTSHFAGVHANIMRAAALAADPSVPHSDLKAVAFPLASLSRSAPTPESAEALFRAAFQLHNFDETVTPAQERLLVLEARILSLGRSLGRSSKKIKDPMIRNFAQQWSQYCGTVAASVHAIEDADEEEALQQLMSVRAVIQPVMARKIMLGVVEDAKRVEKAIDDIFASL